MTKTQYLKLIKKIGNELRANDILYCRIFSDKRKTTGYRTKIWDIFGPNGDPSKVSAIAKAIGGDAIDVVVNYSIQFGSGYKYCNVIITPRKLF